MGKLPDFIIIGCQRGGTTSLYNYITNHPDVESASQKELHFFDYKFNRGLHWYKEQFPDNKITGEASPYYITHPHAPKRIAQAKSDVKIIALLRNPVDRAYSHYHHEVRIGCEKLSFEEAIKNEHKRLEGEVEKMMKDESYYSYAHQHFTYLERGKYVDQLKNWFKYFNNNQILILPSESFFNNIHISLKKVFEFLNLSVKSEIEKKIYNLGNYSPLEPDIRKELSEYFSPYNKRLYAYLQRDYGW